MDVDYVVMLLPYIPSAVTSVFSLESVFTYLFPKADVTDVIASETDISDKAGRILSGTVIVKLTDLLPTVVLPDLVVTVTVAVADVPEMAFIHSSGIVNAVPDVTVWL